MTTENIILLIVVLACFIATYIINFVSSKKYTPLLCIIVSLCICCIVYTILTPTAFDLISTSNIWLFYAPFGVALLYLPFILFKSSVFLRLIFFTLISSLLVFCLDYPSPFKDFRPQPIGQIFLILLWIATTFGLKLINIYSIQTYQFTGIFGFGIFILCLIDAIPLSLGMLGLFLSATTIALIFASKNHPLTPNLLTSECIGIIIGAFIVCSNNEASISSSLIFTNLFLCEILYSFTYTLFHNDKFTNLGLNTAFGIAFKDKCPLQIINHFWIRINLMMLVFGVFQAYAPNQYSLLLICILISCWQQHRIANWQEQEYSLQNAGANIIKEINQTSQELKHQINKINKKQ